MAADVYREGWWGRGTALPTLGSPVRADESMSCEIFTAYCLRVLFKAVCRIETSPTKRECRVNPASQAAAAIMAQGGGSRLSVEAALRMGDHDKAPPIQTYARTETLGNRLAGKLVASDLLHDEALDAGAGAALAVLCQREKPVLSALAPEMACTQRVGRWA